MKFVDEVRVRIAAQLAARLARQYRKFWRETGREDDRRVACAYRFCLQNLLPALKQSVEVA